VKGKRKDDHWLFQEEISPIKVKPAGKSERNIKYILQLLHLLEGEAS
jgi:hypothetical protein